MFERQPSPKPIKLYRDPETLKSLKRNRRTAAVYADQDKMKAEIYKLERKRVAEKYSRQLHLENMKKAFEEKLSRLNEQIKNLTAKYEEQLQAARDQAINYSNNYI